MGSDAIRSPNPVGVRVILFASAVSAFAIAWVGLDARLSDLVPGSGGIAIAGRFFSRALSPAWRSEAQFVPDQAPPLLEIVFEATLNTLLVGAAAMSLSLVLGLVLGFAASTAWWSGGNALGTSGVFGVLRRSLFPALCGVSRLVIIFMRSIHELLWAVLFLAAIGLNNLAAVLAIAIPYAGVLAKIFSELVDEAPRNSADALRGLGAGGFQTYCFGLLPRALPDLIAYVFYRFECALRSSAILGFFGFPTLGLYIRQSFNATNYGEVWTFLYALLALVIVADAWGAAVRRRVLA
ncbi:MAG: ABC transporter permease subunit [bacterium]|nr:ABC transporter permease subunit [bacterium]